MKFANQARLCSAVRNFEADDIAKIVSNHQMCKTLETENCIKSLVKKRC